MRYSILFFLICVFVSACSNQPRDTVSNTPSWISGSSDQYPKQKYLLGVGEADRLSDASARARSELAKIFNVEIHESSTDRLQYSNESKTGADASTSLSSSVTRDIQANTSQVLEGVEISQTWTDPKTQRVYALASLSRAKSSLILREQIENLDSTVNNHISSAQSSDSLIEKIRFAGEAVSAQTARERLNKQLKIVSNVGNGVDSQVSLAELISNQKALSSRLSIRPAAQGRYKSELESALGNTLANEGFTVSDQGEYVLMASLTSTALPEKAGWYFHKSVLTISLLNPAGDRLGGYDWNYRPSATQRALVEARVLEMAREHIENNAKEKLFDMLGETPQQ